MKVAVVKDSISQEDLQLLQQRNAVLEAHITECGSVQTACSENLDTMRTNLNALQDLVVKCRAVLSIHATPASAQSTPPISPAKETSYPPPPLLDSGSAFAASHQTSHAALKSEIELLKAQLDIYKSDFAAERIARLALLAEKNRLASELQQLQQQNRTLIADALNGQAEQLTYSRRCSRMSQESEGATMSAASITNETPQQHSIVDGREDSYLAERKASYCQHCNGVFGDIQSLETHIDECPAY
nr:optineurin-like [Aedes albopictus]